MVGAALLVHHAWESTPAAAWQLHSSARSAGQGSLLCRSQVHKALRRRQHACHLDSQQPTADQSLYIVEGADSCGERSRAAGRAHLKKAAPKADPKRALLCTASSSSRLAAIFN
mmetsp:Transcript_77501/g.128455  ORF Transcript_77501/g.128455 Transcript_77501/m.128455 type:complete len:114 (+) Transcript_77501:16-357(+)